MPVTRLQCQLRHYNASDATTMRVMPLQCQLRHYNASYATTMPVTPLVPGVTTARGQSVHELWRGEFLCEGIDKWRNMEEWQGQGFVDTIALQNYPIVYDILRSF